MSHQPFENWILEEDIELSDEQLTSFNSHLETCEDCSKLQHNLVSALSFIQAAPTHQPSPGFAGRWLKSVEERKALEQKRLISQMLLFLGMAFVGTLGILIGISLFTSSPISVLLNGVKLITRYYVNFVQIKGIVMAYINALPPVIPVFFWLLITGTLSTISLFWVFTMWRVSTQKVQVLQK